MDAWVIFWSDIDLAKLTSSGPERVCPTTVLAIYQADSSGTLDFYHTEIVETIGENIVVASYSYIWHQ